MLPKTHMYIGILFSIILYFIFPAIGFFGILVVFLSSVLIDIDHYAIYVYRNKDWSLKKAFDWFIGFKELRKKSKKKWVSPISILHTIEVLFLISILAIYNQFVFLILIGFLFHSICDILEMGYKNELYGREFFFMNYIMNYNNEKYL